MHNEQAAEAYHKMDSQASDIIQIVLTPSN